MDIKPIFVIIAGGSGSGKTTVANLIKQEIPKAYGCEIIGLDNFYLPKNKIKTDNYDSPEAIDWFLVRETIRFLVEEKKEISIPQYDFKTQTYKGKKKIYPADVIILEGILTLTNAEVYEAADIKIYVDVSDDERLIRRILRDKTERGADVKKTIDMWRNTVIKSHHLYVEPGKYVADLIVPWGEQHNLLAIKAVAGAIEYEAYLKRHIRKTKK